MQLRLKNKVAVVTGSGMGIGKAVAIAMAREGAKVVTNNRRLGTSGGDAELTAKQIRDMGGQAAPFFGDVGDFETARQLIQMAVDSFGSVDILANIAGTNARSMIWETTEEEIDDIIRIHIKGTFNCIRHACGIMMQQRWGRIINTSSLVWLRETGFASYGVAKAGIMGLTRAVATDLSDYGITCNAISPIAKSRMLGTAEAVARVKQQYEAGIVNKQFLEMATNPPDPATIPPLLLYLCTDEAANISGHLFRIVGGLIADCWHPLNRKAINKPEGLWTVEELSVQIPETLLEGYIDPSKI